MATFGVLFVCTGNVCRSPLAEQVFRARFGSPAITFSSAGTAALAGQEMAQETATVSRSLGGYPDGHVARQLTAQMIESSHLVIALTRAHRSDVVRLVPRASRYAFTLRELVRLTESGASDARMTAAFRDTESLAGALREALPLVAARRGHIAPLKDARDDDVPDPYRRSMSAHVLAGRLVDEAAVRIRAVADSVARQL